MQDNNLVSIVLPVYSGKAYLKEQIESILAQSYCNIELIICDDNSTDGSFDIAINMAAADNRIRVYRNQRNLGLVPNFLQSVSLAKGDFICFCDQDDYWLSNKIEILKALLDENNKNMLAYSDLEICDKNLKVISSSFFRTSGLRPKEGYLRELTFLKNITPGCSMIFRKEVADLMVRVPFDAPFMHDHLALILASGLGKIAYSKEALIKYRQHERNNIGAFYPSVIDKAGIIKGLREKLSYFKMLSFDNLDLDLIRISEFCDCLKKGNIFKRLGFIRYYLFLRNDSFRDKILGFFECLMPSSYAWLRKMKGSPRPFGARNDVTFSTWIMRTLFIAWVFIVLFFFTKEFIFYKVIKFLEYTK